MNQKLALIIFAFAFMVAIVAGFYSPEREAPAPAAAMREGLRKTREKNASKEAIPAPSPHSSASARNPASAPDPRTSEPPLTKKTYSGLNEEAFNRKYGDEISFSRDDTRVVRMNAIAGRSENLTANQRVSDFHSANASELIGRAREIFSDSRALLGISNDIQFLAPKSTPGDPSGHGQGQVVFQQAIDGVPIYPGGLVSVLIGPDGELRTLDSSVYPSIQVENVASIAVPLESEPVLFVTQSAPVTLLRRAYVIQNRGVQSVVDATTGAELLKLNRRIR
ncbi:MAG: hypothetical protein H7301_11155 [Cryobacterium sp.]|nr:hypothetical protein [Oligoflexia bacterium]